MKRIISFVHNDFEDLELWYPILRLREAGHEVLLAGEAGGEHYTGKYGIPASADIGFGDAEALEPDGLLVPGGWAPDKLRRFPEVLELTRAVFNAGKPVGQICHAGWVLISAGILRGKRVTSTPGIRDDMENAGAVWFDEPVVVDGNLISSRRPPDLPDYMREYLKVLK